MDEILAIPAYCHCPKCGLAVAVQKDAVGCMRDGFVQFDHPKYTGVCSNASKVLSVPVEKFLVRA